MKTLVSETIPKFNTFFEMRLCSNDGGNGFFVGKEVGAVVTVNFAKSVDPDQHAPNGAVLSGLRMFLFWNLYIYFSISIQ